MTQNPMLTEHQRAVLAHVLIEEDADDWLARAIGLFGADGAAQALTAKIAEHEAAYFSARAEQGGQYRTAAQRHADDMALMAERDAVESAARSVRAAAVQTALQQAIATGDAARLAELLTGGQ